MYCQYCTRMRLEWAIFCIFCALHIGSVIYCQSQVNLAANKSTVYLTPPLPKDSPYPRLLHERDVIHYVNSKKEFVVVGDGVYANVYLGKLRSSGKHVAIKSFRDSSFREIMREVRMHRYAQQFVRTPRLIGLLPAGPMAPNISLVYEYISHSRSISNWMDEGDEGGFTTTQWLLVCRQLAVILQHIHKADIFFNDLHRGNVLVQKLFDKVRVLIIDFGMATYNRGKSYRKTNDTLDNYNFLAPELREITTTKISDIFSMGHTFFKIAKVLNMTGLFHLSAWCKSWDPEDRPTLQQVIVKLDSLLFEQSLLNKRESRPSPTSHPLGSSMLNSRGVPLSHTSNEENSVEWEWLTGEGHVLSPACSVPLHVISEQDVYEDSNDKHDYISKTTHDSIRLATLKIGNQTVIVKDFYEVEYDEVIKEACVTSYLSQKDIAPRVLGILIEYKNMHDVAFIQERYGHGVTLKEFVLHTAGFEWNTEKQKNISVGNFTFEDHSRKIYIPLTTSPFNLTKVFLALFVSPRKQMCEFKSPRQVLIEQLSAQTVELVKATHRAGMLINNLISNNVLIKWIGYFNGKADIEVKLIDLKRSTSIDEGFHFGRSPKSLARFSYLAPEVIQGQRASTSSDVYSLCVLLQGVMSEYLTANNVLVGLEEYVKNRDVTRRYSHSVDYDEKTLQGHEHCGESRMSSFRFDSNYIQFQHLLLKCLSSSPQERPHVDDLSHILSLMRSQNVWANSNS